jgi:nicotinate-nucleotide adenylyltransferase
MEFFRRANATPSRLGILPGTFNPVTVAHIALGTAALAAVDQVLFVLPRALPHKSLYGACFRERMEMLVRAIAGESRFSAAATEGGLFVDIARECAAHYGPDVRLALICGRDAAERIVSWDYGRPGVVPEMLREFDLLVAARQGEYDPPPALHGAIRTLPLGCDVNSVSATEVRRRIACGGAWEHLVPEPVREQARGIYGRRECPRLP